MQIVFVNQTQSSACCIQPDDIDIAHATKLPMLLWLAGKAGYVCGHAAVAAASNQSSLVRLCWLQ